MKMVDVYLTKIDFLQIEAYINRLSEIMPYIDKLKIQYRENSKEAIHSIVGEAMVRTIIARKSGILPREISFSKTYYGKPYIEGSTIQFNVSHSGEYIICGISTEPVGIDIEEMRDHDIACIAERFFSKSELEFLTEEKSLFLERFYELWVLRESYLKWMGVGLTKALDSFFISITNENIIVNDKSIEILPFSVVMLLMGIKLLYVQILVDFRNK